MRAYCGWSTLGRILNWPASDSQRHVVEQSTPRYSAPMDKLEALLDRLQTRQRDLITEAAQYDTMPADSTLKRIAELENAIAAVEAVADEERSRRRQ